MDNKNTDSVSSEVCINQKQFTCDICQKEFFTRRHYQLHSIIHMLPEHFESCDDCQDGFTHILSLNKHLEIHDNPMCISSSNEPAKKHDNESNSTLITQRDSLFRCGTCKKVFLEKCNLDEHCQNHCMKKGLNFDEDFVSFTSVPSLFHASEDDYVASPEVSGKCKILRIYTAEVQNENVCSENSPKIKQFVCKVCQKVLPNSKCSLTIHFATHSHQKTFNCGLCEKKFTLKCLLSAHLRTHKVKEVFCGVCHKGFASKEKLFNHVYVHALVESFSCNVCEKTFSEKSFLEKHYVSHLKEKPSQKEFKCGLCSKILSNEILLNVHERTHATSAPYVCDVCSKTFTRSDNMLRHYLIHTGDKPYKCETCEKSFRQKSDVTKHFNQVHTYRRTKFPHSINWREKSFKCETCGKGFTSKQSLMGHRFQHTGESPFVCEICNKAFARKFQLKDHMPTHSGEKPFTCKTCKKKFATKSTLRVHSAIHGEYTPYVCEVCQKGFGKRGLLTKHLRVHTGERPFPCTLCQKKFTQKSHLVTHIQGVHKNEI